MTSLLKKYPGVPLGLVFVSGALAYVVAQAVQMVVNAVQHPSASWCCCTRW